MDVMRPSLAIIACAAVWGTAAAAAPSTKQELESALEDLPTTDPSPPPRFAFSNDDVYVAGKMDGVRPNFGASAIKLSNVVVASASDGKSAWLAADALAVPQSGDCAPGPCGRNHNPPLHVTALLERDAKGWNWIAWHITDPVPGSRHADLAKLKIVPDKLDRAVAGAEDVVKVFEASLTDSAALAATLSTRKDVVLYGSEAKERTLGGAKVKAKLAGWKLAFALRDGVQAGLTANKNVAWVAANVDARSAKRPKDPATPYRVLAIYELTDKTWKLVQLQFSVDTN
jgi:hypothetical protein